ncbi:cytochrome oxidase assembly protein 1 [Sorochytrium milnesiophthora]
MAARLSRRSWQLLGLAGVRRHVSTNPTMSLPKQTRKPQSGTITMRQAVGGLAFTGAMYGLLEWFWNIQRKKNSVMDSLLFQLRNSDTLREELGNRIDLSGWQWIHGTINQVKGLVDISFDIEGSKGRAATVSVKMVRSREHVNKWVTQSYVISVHDAAGDGAHKYSARVLDNNVLELQESRVVSAASVV